MSSEPMNAAEAEWQASQRRWILGRGRLVLANLPLAYLAFLAQAVAENSRGGQAVWGYAIIAAFAACWLGITFVLFRPEMPGSPWRFWTAYAVLCALFLAELPFGRAASFVMCVFITMLTIGHFGIRGMPIVLALAAAALLVPVEIGSWHVSLGASFDDVTPVAIPIAGLIMAGAVQIIRSSQALAEAHAEIARLAAENERIRIARDLHDLLGHSLTTITVKAGLARRLGEATPGPANQQIAEVEALARQSLADMRAAVANYRDVNLSRELATGRELLRAAGITADLPGAADVVDPAHQELFGWVVREGLTNIVRHAHASRCAVRLSRSSVEIIDDGIGAGPAAGAVAAGNGLAGLTERVAAAGGTVQAGPVQPRGWRLLVSLAGVGEAA